MNNGFLSIVQRHQFKVRDGTLKNSKYKTARKENPKSNQCSILFAIFKILCVKNVCMLLGQKVHQTLRKRVIHVWSERMLHSDHAPSHHTFCVEYVGRKTIPVILKPLTILEYFLFSKLKNQFLCHHFESVDNIQKTVIVQLKVLKMKNFLHM